MKTRKEEVESSLLIGGMSVYVKYLMESGRSY